MKLFERDTALRAYDNDMNEIVIQVVEDSDGEEKLFVGSRIEWKKRVEGLRVFAR